MSFMSAQNHCQKPNTMINQSCIDIISNNIMISLSNQLYIQLLLNSKQKQYNSMIDLLNYIAIIRLSARIEMHAANK